MRILNCLAFYSLSRTRRRTIYPISIQFLSAVGLNIPAEAIPGRWTHNPFITVDADAKSNKSNSNSAQKKQTPRSGQGVCRLPSKGLVISSARGADLDAEQRSTRQRHLPPRRYRLSPTRSRCPSGPKTPEPDRSSQFEDRGPLPERLSRKGRDAGPWRVLGSRGPIGGDVRWGLRRP